jgi:hypothetical protein
LESLRLDGETTECQIPIPCLLGQVNLNITLTKRLPPRARSRKYSLANEACLIDDAFEPKSFKLRIEEGDFETRAGSQSKLLYKKRLVFDPSPYPPISEWKKVRYAKNLADFKTFVGHCPQVESFVANHSSFGFEYWEARVAAAHAQVCSRVLPEEES